MLKRRILVTGGSRGIGRAVVVELLKQGHDVVTISRSPSPYSDVSSVTTDLGDLGHLKAVLSSARELLEENKPFDVLVNNAGICSWQKFPMQHLGLVRELRRTMNTNFNSPVVLTNHFLKDLQPFDSKTNARVVNLTSRVAHRGDSEELFYAASKAALLNFTKSMSRDRRFADKVGFWSVSPCWVETDMMTSAGKTETELTADIPIGRTVRTAEVANVVSFLVNEAPMASTGSDFAITGGAF
jgi:3-oxoacyl-[acyl-carrier protein] reductase